MDFQQESFDTVFIILDKMDKIGLDGVAEELEKEGFAKECIETYLGMFKEITNDIEGVRFMQRKTEGCAGSEGGRGSGNHYYYSVNL